MSIFDLMFDHPRVTWENKHKCYQWMTNPSLPRDELNRYHTFLDFILLNVYLCLPDASNLCSDWIVFTAPKALSIPGHVVRHCLKLNGTFTISIVDAIMVLWNYLDSKVYNHFQRYEQEHKIWRHFLPASFAVYSSELKHLLSCKNSNIFWTLAIYLHYDTGGS